LKRLLNLYPPALHWVGGSGGLDTPLRGAKDVGVLQV